MRRNRLKAADGRESGRSVGLVKGEQCLVSVRGVTKCAEQDENKTKRNGAFYYRERPDILWYR